ncbi:hypothetical protein QTP88_024691 [Uroleucon formosanum]
MVSRQWSASKCGDRQPVVSPTRTVDFFTGAATTDGRVSAKNNRKTAASNYITRAQTRTHTTTIVTAASGSNGSSSCSSIVVPSECDNVQYQYRCRRPCAYCTKTDLEDYCGVVAMTANKLCASSPCDRIRLSRPVP